MVNYILLALLVAVVAIMWQGFPMLFGPSGPNYSTASTADNQDLLKHLGKVQDGDPITKWLTRPPGARYAIGKPDKEEGAVPIIKLGWLCSAICKKTKFPVVVDNKCAACLTLFSLPTWSHDENGKPNPPLARLPVYESGMPALAAIPLLYPRRWTSADLLQGFGLTDYAATADAQTLANDNWQGGINPQTTTWTIDGVTRPAVSKMRAATPPVCVDDMGWITPAGANPCPGGDNLTDVDVHFPSLEAVGGEGLPLSYGGAEHYRAISLVLTKEAFASADSAAAAIFDTMQTAYSTVIFLRNVTARSRLGELKALYGKGEWDDINNNQPRTMEKMAEDGDLVEVDLTFYQGLLSTAPSKDGSAWWNVAAHALFRVEGGRSDHPNLADYPLPDGVKPGSDEPVPLPTNSLSIKPVAILLSNQPKDPKAKLVYTPSKSEGAYIIAALALRQAAFQTAIWVGHVYHLHIQSVAATVALYNNIDPQKNVYYSTHPVRQILDFYADPTYVSEFHTTLFAAGYRAGPGTAAGVPDLLSLWNAYAIKGIVHNDTTWAGCTIPSQLDASGLSEDRFRGKGEEGSWEALPGVAMNLAIRRKVVAPYAKSVIYAAYKDDKAVADDHEVQAFGAALVAQHGSNLGRINDENNKLQTRAQLAKFVEDYVTIVLTHGSAHLQDYSMRVLNVALNPPRLGQQTAPHPKGSYSHADYLRWVPTTGTAARQYTFVANFIGTTFLPVTSLVASQQFLKGGEPSWEDGTPYYTGPNADKVEKAHQKFLREASYLMRNTPRSHGLRAVATNFQDPTRLPRVINI